MRPGHDLDRAHHSVRTVGPVGATRTGVARRRPRREVTRTGGSKSSMGYLPVGCHICEVIHIKTEVLIKIKTKPRVFVN